MVKGFKDGENIFHPITQSRGVRKSRDQTVKTQGINVTRYKKFIPRVTIQKHGKGNNFNYTVNLAGRGMYVVGTKDEAEERAQDMRESVQISLKNGAVFDRDGYVTSYDRKRHDMKFPMSDKQILRHFSGVETGGVRQCNHCSGWYKDDNDELVEHLANCGGKS